MGQLHTLGSAQVPDSFIARAGHPKGNVPSLQLLLQLYADGEVCRVTRKEIPAFWYVHCYFGPYSGDSSKLPSLLHVSLCSLCSSARPPGLPLVLCLRRHTLALTQMIKKHFAKGSN